MSKLMFFKSHPRGWVKTGLLLWSWHALQSDMSVVEQCSCKCRSPVWMQVLVCMCVCICAALDSGLHSWLSTLPICPFTSTLSIYEINCLSYLGYWYMLIIPAVYLVDYWVCLNEALLFFAKKHPSELWCTDLLSLDVLTVPAWPMAKGKPEDENKASGARTSPASIFVHP